MNGDATADGGSDDDGAAGDAGTAGSPPPLVEHRREELRDRLSAADGLLLCLDFDGTLAPIVADPDAAAMRAETRRALARLQDRPAVEVAVVSGRALADVADRVGVPGVHYAGNHGFEVAVDGETALHPGAAECRPAVERAVADLESRLDGVPGVVVEDKGATATVHYRETPDGRVGRVRDAVEAAVGDDLRVTAGKQVLEVRPAVDCDKGAAVRRLSRELPGALVAYVGDDETDEAAFRAVAPDGVGVHVGDRVDTAAGYRVPDPDGVAALLDWLADDGVRHLADGAASRLR